MSFPGIGCIVLAAGSSRRFGSDKRLARLPNGMSVLEQTLSHVPEFAQRLLVLHRGDEELARRFPDWRVVVAQDAHKGMGYSLATAMRYTRDWDGAVIALADMPFVAPASIEAIAAKLSRDRLVLPFHQGRRGNPVGIGAAFFAELAGLDGDQGARALLQRHMDSTVRLDLDDPGILMDVDTPEALHS